MKSQILCVNTSNNRKVLSRDNFDQRSRFPSSKIVSLFFLIIFSLSFTVASQAQAIADLKLVEGTTLTGKAMRDGLGAIISTGLTRDADFMEFNESNVKVTIDGQSVPVSFISDYQINISIPPSVSAGKHRLNVLFKDEVTASGNVVITETNLNFYNNPSGKRYPTAWRNWIEARARAEAAAYILAQEQAPMPHMDSMSKMQEHLAAFKLVDFRAATHTAILSGNWSDPDTWMDRQVPSEGAKVWIMPNRTVTVDQVFPQAYNTIRVTGTLRFAPDVNTQLRVDTIVTDTAGTFQMGTSSQPIMPGVTAKLLFTDGGAVDRFWDPFWLSRGFISHGISSIYGAEKTSFISLQSHPDRGETMLRLDGVPNNWKVGDDVVITALTRSDEPMARKILKINGNRVIVAPVNLTRYSLPSEGLKSYIANTTRNAIFESENKTDITRRGHVMFMHNRNVHIAYAGFYGLGRTDKRFNPINDAEVDAAGNLIPGTGTNPRGRYAVHFHRSGTSRSNTPATVVGCAVVGSPGWGYVNHGSYVNMDDNVAYDVAGASFVGEIGSEIGRFNHNIGLKMIGSVNGRDVIPNVQDYGRGGSMVFAVGGGIDVTNNVANGFKGAAYRFYSYDYVEDGQPVRFDSANLRDPASAGGAPTVRNNFVPFYLNGNTAFAGSAGFYVSANAGGLASVLKNELYWNVGSGYGQQYTPGTTILDSTFLGDKDSYIDGAGVALDFASQRDYERLRVENFRWGIVANQGGRTIIKDVVLKNIINVIIPRLDIWNWDPSTPRMLTTIDNAQFQSLTPQQLHGQTHYDIFVPNELPVGQSPPDGDLAQWTMRLSGFFDAGDGSVRPRRTWGLFQDQQVTLDNRQIYSLDQRPDFVVHDTGIPEIDGRTNQQLWDAYHLTVGDAMMPATAAPDPNISIFGGRLGLDTPLRPSLSSSFNIYSFQTDTNGVESGILIVKDLTNNNQILYNQRINLRRGANFYPNLVTDGNGNTRSILVWR